MSPIRSRYLSSGGCRRRLVADPEVPGVRLFVLDRDDALDDERARDLGGASRGRCDAFEHHRPALFERAVDGRLHADEDVPRLLQEPVQERVDLLLLRRRQRLPASKLDMWIAGRNSGVKSARIVCRTKSVDVTRVIPSR